MKFQTAWIGKARQLKNYLDWVGAEGNDHQPEIFGDVSTYPGSAKEDGYIVISPTTKYICNNEVRNLVDDLLESKIGQGILCFNLDILEDPDNGVIYLI